MSGVPPRRLSPLDARVLRTTGPLRERTVERIARTTGRPVDVARICLRRLRGQMLVEGDGGRPARWHRARHDEVALEHQPG